MRLITWNVNSLRARLPRVLELLSEQAPDVLCLQETKCPPEAFPHDPLAALGYRAQAWSQGRWNGVALLTPADVEPTGVVRGLDAPCPSATEARWLEADVDGVRVVCAYVPNGRDPAHPAFRDKLAFLDAAAERAARLVATGPTVVAGDLNVAPEDRDVWDPGMFVGATHVTPAERDRLRALERAGLVDAFRAVAPDAEGYTYWDYRAGALRRNLGMRIDLVLVSTQLRVRTAEVHRAYRRPDRHGNVPSDHAPLAVELLS